MALNTLPNAGLTNRGYPSDRIADPIIINGDMSVSQRGYTSATAIGSSNAYNLDRYIGREVTDGGLNVEQSTTAPTGFKNSLKVTVSSADSSLSADQRAYLLTKIEGNRVAQLAFGTSDARKITLAFYIRASVTGTFSGSITNEAENRSFPFTYIINSVDTWERKVVNIDADTSGTWDTDNTTGLEIYFSLGMGSTYSGTAGSWAGAQYFAATGATNLIATNAATWHLTGLQLEVGEFDSTSVPSFPFESFSNSLLKCQRYYKEIIRSLGSDTQIANGVMYTTTDFYGVFYLGSLQMRATPTISQTTGSSIYDVLGNAHAHACNSIDAFAQITNGASSNCRVKVSSVSGKSQGQSAWVRYGGPSSTSDFISADAEL